jgi:response regulator of citrate/malate metabolism
MYNVLIVEDDPMVAMINEQFVSRHKDFVVVHKCNDGKVPWNTLMKTRLI